MISDNGIQYTGEAYQQFVCTWGIEHVTRSASYLMPNGLLERAIRTVKNTLDKARKTGINPYLAMLSVRPTPISDKIPSPAEQLLGRKLQINMPSYVIFSQLCNRSNIVLSIACISSILYGTELYKCLYFSENNSVIYLLSQKPSTLLDILLFPPFTFLTSDHTSR